MAGAEINVCIPFDPEANLGREYNRLMRESQREWVLFLDHDALILNPHWHYLCREAITRVPAAGIFTALTGNIGSSAQLLKWAPSPQDSIPAHQEIALKLWRKRGTGLTDITEDSISGFFLLTSRTAWEKAGGFPEPGLFGVDREYRRRVVAAGLRVFRIDGIYVFHLRDRSRGSWIPGMKTSKELWDEYSAAKRARASP
jgi:GT2 family glycosyltransferase